MEQFSRTISLVGQSAFDRVHQARVAVFGVGGVGGYVCEALVRSGIAEIDLFDRDDVSISNLNRQIIALHSTIGQDKVDAMAARLKDINPDVRVNCRKMFYLPTNADEIDLSVYDFVVDAVDTVAAKLELAASRAASASSARWARATSSTRPVCALPTLRRRVSAPWRGRCAFRARKKASGT